MAIDIRLVKFFVEGEADRVFVRDLLKLLYKIELTETQLKEAVIICGGYDGILKQSDEFREIDSNGKREGGKNIVLFDADYTGREENHGLVHKLAYLEKIKAALSLEFEYFLFPNNETDGTIETLLEACINPENHKIMDCWYSFENCLRNDEKRFTIPANKSKIYVYLECLHGTTKTEKDKIKDRNRDFTIDSLWTFDLINNDYLKGLKNFLDKHLTGNR